VSKTRAAPVLRIVAPLRPPLEWARERFLGGVPQSSAGRLAAQRAHRYRGTRPRVSLTHFMTL